MFRNLLVISAFALGAGASYAQAVGDACTPTGTGAFPLTCDPTNATTGKQNLLFCSSQGATANTVQAQDCTLPDAQGANPAAPTGTCGATPCSNVGTSDGCTVFGVDAQADCLSGNNEACGGIGVLFDQDTTNDQFIGFPSCANNAACVTGGTTEVCDSTIPACTTTGLPTCTGDKVTLCIFGNSEDTDGNGAINGTEDKDGDGQVDAFFNPGAFALDCTNSFQDGSGGPVAGTCNAGLTDGPVHQALSAAFQQDLTGTAFADCDLPQVGEGEGEGAAGEGEGEGGAGDACQGTGQSTCGRDKECDGGHCKAVADQGQNPPSCSDTSGGAGAPFVALLALVGVLPLFRRRR